MEDQKNRFLRETLDLFDGLGICGVTFDGFIFGFKSKI